MEALRTLPPLVRGRVTGALDFFIDDIKLTNRLLLANSWDLVLQVQWWGEDLPTCVGPRSIRDLENKIHEKSEIHLRCLRYEIKTTMDLFKLYLQACEVLELCVLDFGKSSIVGSAFLKDLVKLLDKSKSCFILPVFDYSGEEIGNVIVHFNFWEKRKHLNIDNKSDSASESQASRILNKTKEYYHIPTEENFFYDRGKEINFGNSVSHCIDSMKEYVNYAENDSLYERNVSDMEFSCKCLPEIKTVNDSSKVLCFGLSSHKSKKSETSKNSVKNKFNSVALKFKRKSPTAKKPILGEKKISNKKPVCNEVSRNVQKPADKKQNEESQKQTPSISNKIVLEGVPSKEPVQSKVLDYLLGSDLTKEDEESAVNELKKLSPSHNLVTSINKLCLTSDSDSHVSVNIKPRNSKEPFHLSFNLNDPIEKNYYEKFFLKSKSSFNLELAELLNKPENSCVLRNFKSKGTTRSNKNCQVTDYSSKHSQLEKENKKISDNNSPMICKYNNVNDKTKDCSQCKYYKKLNELDTIIESLKHFEEKMRMHESDIQISLKEDSDWFCKKKQLEGS